METGTRERILAAGKELAQESESLLGVTISLESVAQRCGLTKPGLMYHFPTKTALMHGLVENAAQHWDALLRKHAGAEAEKLSPFARHRAYVVVATTATVTRADYWIFSDALYHPSLAAVWNRHLHSWFTVEALDPQTRSLLTAARFCADGAWMSEATGVFPADDLKPVRHHALALIDAAEAGSTLTAAGNGST